MNTHVEDVLAEQLGYFQVHFMLDDGSHNMDALVLHQCEGEIFALLKELGKQLGVDFRIEASAYGEGGLSVFLTFVGKHAIALGFIGTTITAICSAGVWMKYQSVILQQQIAQNDFALNRDRKLAEQQIEQNELAIKKARIELKRLEKETSAAGPKAPATDAGRSLPLEPPPKPGDVVPALLSMPKVLKLRSQFYGHLLEYEKVMAVGFAANHEHASPAEIVVPRTVFNTYVVSPHELEPTIVRDAEIEIISPVFKRDAFKWKGIFEKKTINFEINDEEFLSKVSAQEVKFQNGTALVCDLEIHLRENASEAPEPYAYVVRHVSRHFNKNTSSGAAEVRIPKTPTMQGVKATTPQLTQTKAQQQLSLLKSENDAH